MPLHFAAEREDLPVIRLLVEHGADTIGTGDDHELDVIGWATCFGTGNREVADYLLAHGAAHNIFSAVAMGETDVIRSLAARAPAVLDRPMDRTNHRRRPLHLAVVKQQPLSLLALLDAGADPEATDVSGLTPLDQAAMAGEREMAESLIARGAAITLPAAVGLGRTADIDRLLAEDPGCLYPGHRWERLIIRAAERAPGSVIETLVCRGADVNVRDRAETAVDGTGGYTPLHAAAFSGNLEAAAVLLRHGADPTIREDKYCATPAGWARYAGHHEVRDLILAGPIDVFDAIDQDRPDLIPAILDRDPDALTRPFGKYATCGDRSDPKPDDTPLAWAVRCGKTAAADALAARGADREAQERATLAARFLQFACWDHHTHGKADHRMHDRAAGRLLAQHPWIARANLYTAIVCGELEEVERRLDAHPETGRESGGARGWAPILYLAFTRFTNQQTSANAGAIARALLDRGADANAYYKAGDSHYTALVGVAGEGEQDSPRQPQAEALLPLLLERGAEPFDIQVLYNTHFSTDMLWWLELVYTHTIAQGRQAAWDDPNWAMLDMGGYGPGAYFVLNAAITKNNIRLAEWALAHGAGAFGHTSTHPTFRPRHTLYERAVMDGRTEIAALLARHGAPTAMGPLDDEEAFIQACLRMDRVAVAAWLERRPEDRRSHTAIFAAARRNRADVVAMLLDLGVPIEIENEHKQRPLHEAASYNAVDVARLLIERGAEVDPIEANWSAAPIGFAAYGDRTDMLDFLSRYSKHVWVLAFRGYVDRLRDVLGAEPERARVVSKDGLTPLWWLPDDEAEAIEIARLLTAAGADPSRRSPEGGTAADWATKRGMLELARVLTPTGGPEVTLPA
jgi:ankyrin repeat protein